MNVPHKSQNARINKPFPCYAKTLIKNGQNLGPLGTPKEKKLKKNKT